MDARYAIRDTTGIFSPALVFFKEGIEQNIATVIRMAGADRLRPHVKTHKTREIARMEIAAGITKHKCATLAEAEMLALVEARDVLIAYPLVGPNTIRLANLIRKYPQTRFSTLIDHPEATRALSKAMAEANLEVDVFLDLDVGQQRTGIAPDDRAIALYLLAAKLPGLKPIGFHVYDGHNHVESLVERKAAVEALMEPVLALRRTLEREGFRIAPIICGGTPTFPIFAKMDVPDLECSPGTFVLYDSGYGSKYAELADLVPAALLLTRVISRPAPHRVTLDLGYKAVASDPPAGKRCRFPDLPQAVAILQNEEHLVLETPDPNAFAPGDILYAIPTHICPTVAMYQSAYVIENGEVVAHWEVIARDRVLTV